MYIVTIHMPLLPHSAHVDVHSIVPSYRPLNPVPSDIFNYTAAPSSIPLFVPSSSRINSFSLIVRVFAFGTLQPRLLLCYRRWTVIVPRTQTTHTHVRFISSTIITRVAFICFLSTPQSREDPPAAIFLGLDCL